MAGKEIKRLPFGDQPYKYADKYNLCYKFVVLMLLLSSCLSPPKQPPAMQIAVRGVVFAGQEKTDSQSCAFPSICVMPGGRWLCAFRAAPMKTPMEGQHVLLAWSDDEGKTWTAPMTPFTPPDIDGKAGLFHGAYLTPTGGNRLLAVIRWVDHSTPGLPFFNEETEGLLDTRIFLSWSDDKGETWSEPQLVDTSPYNVPTSVTGPALLFPDGELALQFELNKHYDDLAEWRHASVLMFSRDGGVAWPRHTLASSDPENKVFYWDQRPSLVNGAILDVFWTFDRENSAYRNIHARESTDRGLTWSELWDTGVPGQPAPPLLLPDGRIVLCYVDRTGAPVIKARVSMDGGKTWPDRDELTVFSSGSGSQTDKKATMQDAWKEMGKFSIGLPATALLPDGDFIVVYYAGPETDVTGIHWARVHPNITK